MRHLGSLPTQTHSVADQLAELAACPGRNGTSSDQTVPQQIGQPLGIFDIRLATRHSLDVARVGYQEVHARVFQHVVDRLPKPPVDSIAT
jgi:hypothetical protein